MFVLCRSVYCLCVNVYFTTATGWQPNCSYKYIISYQNNKRCTVQCIKIKYNKIFVPAFTLKIKKKNTCLAVPFNFLRFWEQNVFYALQLLFWYDPGCRRLNERERKINLSLQSGMFPTATRFVWRPNLLYNKCYSC